MTERRRENRGGTSILTCSVGSVVARRPVVRCGAIRQPGERPERWRCLSHVRRWAVGVYELRTRRAQPVRRQGDLLRRRPASRRPRRHDAGDRRQRPHDRQPHVEPRRPAHALRRGDPGPADVDERCDRLSSRQRRSVHATPVRSAQRPRQQRHRRARHASDPVVDRHVGLGGLRQRRIRREQAQQRSRRLDHPHARRWGQPESHRGRRRPVVGCQRRSLRVPRPARVRVVVAASRP